MKEKTKDKLIFYVGFLDSFIKRGEQILKDFDIQGLKMTREYILDSIEEENYK